MMESSQTSGLYRTSKKRPQPRNKQFHTEPYKWLHDRRRIITMPVVDRVGPLPDGRPAKGFSIIFGMKRPESAEKK